MIVLVASHDGKRIDSFPKIDSVQIVDLNALDEGKPSWFSQAANSRIFLDGRFGEVGESLAIISGRFFSRLGSPPDIETLLGVGSSLREGEYICFQGSRAWGRFSGNQWIRQQDYVHPGMGAILKMVMQTQQLEFQQGSMFFPLGGQFIVTKSTFDSMHVFLNKAISDVLTHFSDRPPFRYRCHMCGRVSDSGFGRWTDERHLGYLLERLESLFFACSSMAPIVHSADNHFKSNLPKWHVGKDVFSTMYAWTLETMGKVLRAFSRRQCTHQFSYANQSMSESDRSL